MSIVGCFSACFVALSSAPYNSPTMQRDADRLRQCGAVSTLVISGDKPLQPHPPHLRMLPHILQVVYPIDFRTMLLGREMWQLHVPLTQETNTSFKKGTGG